MMKFVHLLCLGLFAQAATAMQLDLLKITERSFMKTMDSVMTAVKKEHHIIRQFVTPSSQDQSNDLNLSHFEGQVKSHLNFSTVGERLLNNHTIIESLLASGCSMEDDRKLDAILNTTLTLLKLQTESAKNCVYDDLDRNNIIENMVAAGCIKYIEVQMPKIVEAVGSELLAVANSCIVRLRDKQEETVRDPQPNTRTQL